MRANCKRQVTIDDGCVPVTALVIGMMDNNCFIVADGRERGAPAVVVDPAGDAEAIQKALGWFKARGHRVHSRPQRPSGCLA